MNTTTIIRPVQTRGIAALLAVAVLGIAAVAGGTYSLTRDDGVAPAPRSSATLSLPPAQERPLTVYYIVASQDEADTILAAEAAAQEQRDASGSPSLQRDLHFFVVTNAEEEQHAWDVLAGSDEFVQIVDTLHPMLAIPSPDALAAEDIATPATLEAAGACDSSGLTDPEAKVLLANFCQ